VGRLDQDSCAVSRIWIATTGATVGKVLDRPSGFDYDIVGFPTAHVRNSYDPTSSSCNRRFVARLDVSLIFIQFCYSIPCSQASRSSSENPTIDCSLLDADTEIQDHPPSGVPRVRSASCQCVAPHSGRGLVLRQVHSRRSYPSFHSCLSHKARLHFIEPFLDNHAIMDGAGANYGQYETYLLSELPARHQNGQ
jgi:hypothetical protein